MKGDDPKLFKIAGEDFTAALNGLHLTIVVRCFRGESAGPIPLACSCEINSRKRPELKASERDSRVSLIG